MSILSNNRIKWDEQIEMLARHLCEQKGINPDAPYTLAIKNWQNYVDDAENYLRRRVLNKFYWEYLCGQND